MGVRYTLARLARPALLLLAFAGFVPCHAATDSHPQEVLDLVAAYDALAMKVRPLQKRVVVSSREEKSTKFNPDGRPVRAKVDTSADDGADTRVPERLRHKTREAAYDDAAAGLLGRLNALEKRILAERERINRPEYGAGLRAANADGEKADKESGGVQFGDGIRGKRTPLDESRQKLAKLEQEFAELEREADALERR